MYTTIYLKHLKNNAKLQTIRVINPTNIDLNFITKDSLLMPKD